MHLTSNPFVSLILLCFYESRRPFDLILLIDAMQLHWITHIHTYKPGAFVVLMSISNQNDVGFVDEYGNLIEI